MDYVSYTSSNYALQTEKKTTVGGIIKADVDWAFCPYMGIGAGVFGSFNSFATPVGFQLKLICGWLNPKKKN